MSFRKPFRAPPIKLGPYHLAQQRRRRRIACLKFVGGAMAAGAAAGISVAFAEGLDASNPRMHLEQLFAGSATPVFFRRCDDARAAGVAPIYSHQPGYRSGLDRDGDGLACEPYLTG